MLNVNIIAVGNLKEKYLLEASDEYKKRISRYAKLNIIEIAEERLSDNPSDKEIQKALDLEAVRILDATKKTAIVALCVEGKQCTSPQFAEFFEKSAVDGISDISFVIGSSYGLSDAVKQKASQKLSFSKMTLPHQLCRIVLLEQIYRAMNILNNGKYHK